MSENMIQVIERMMATPITFQMYRTHLDDLSQRPRVLMIWLRFVFKIFFRPWPFYLTISFPTRTRLIRELLTRDKRVLLWIKPWLKLGKL
jgi:hypothetical protein